MLESEMSGISAIVTAVSRWFSRVSRANRKSRMLSGPEIIALRARMAAHGVDDESRDERERKAAAK